ncbi:MAG: hypothetical protein AABX14_03580 [Candidatus Aenigmatarchaeota archaeon]
MKYKTLLASGLILLSTIAYVSALSNGKPNELTDITYRMRHLPRSILK